MAANSFIRTEHPHKRPRLFEAQVAYNALNRLRLASETDNSEGPFHCVECGDEMVLQQGMKYAWRFAHNATGGDGGDGELYEHCYAKRLISSSIRRWTFTDNCTCCNTHMQTHRFSQAKEDMSFDEFRLDVTAFDDDGNCVAAIEIFRTHRIGPDKRARLEHKDLAVIEVTATDIIKAAEAEDFLVRSICTRICDGCVSRAVNTEARRVQHDLNGHVIEQRLAAAQLEMLRLYKITEAAEAAENASRNQADRLEREVQRQVETEVDFMTDVYMRDRVYLALPQHRKADAAAVAPIQWDPRADWDNPAVAPRLTAWRLRHVRPCGSFWATAKDALQLMPFWRPEFIPFAANLVATPPLFD